MTNALCEVKDGANPFVPTLDGVDVTPGNVIVIRLIGPANVWTLELFGTDDSTDAEDVGIVFDYVLKTATFTMPAGTGRALMFRSTIDNGRNEQGALDTSHAATFGIYSPTPAGLRVISANETNEGSVTHGWSRAVNAIIRSYTGP